MDNRTTVSLDKPTAADLRQARREMSAAERRTLTTSEVLRRLLDSWRQITAGGRAVS